MSARLSNASLSNLPKRVQRPNYDRAEVNVGIVHLGIGAFHRAHQAVYVDDLLANNPDWAIVGVSLRRPDTKDALMPQDGMYTLAVRDASGTKCRVIGSLHEVIDANAERERALELMAAPATKIISLTITEKGYCHDPSTGELDVSHPDIVHDLAHPDAPISAPGMIVEAIARRKAAGVAAFTVMSCDNLPANGKTTRTIVSALATLRNAELGRYVNEHMAFPSTMVDRIVPATTDADSDEISKILGCTDAWPIVTEPFTQWVVEDNFPAGRPPFEEVGAQLVDDVEAFELMKLRMLNGSHSSIAYLGYLAGHETVADTVQQDDYRNFIFALMTNEIIPTLDMPDADLPAYRDALLQRFSNPALHHRTWQIAMDGSQKLPQRLLDTIRQRIAENQSYARLCLGVAGWINYALGTDEKGEKIDVRDPLVGRYQTIAAQTSGDVEKTVDAFLQIEEIFGTDLPANAAFRTLLVDTLRKLQASRAASIVASLI